MQNSINAEKVEEKLNDFLVRACEAENKRDYVEANRLFRYALFCEARLCPYVGNAKEYVQQVGAVYSGPEALREKNCI